ncbi:MULTISPECIES: helix-turn-helix domain-containing protein [Myxococcaceae]|uniref:helix-turn-helix domain-containing protein n=1 Tax=Myxococcaceae TaxID=31 RepID=UPI00188EA759|nr:transposase [Simulacricoccus sp. 17bor-14]
MKARALRERVRRMMRGTPDARLARRLVAVLQVLEGERPGRVATLMGVSRSTVHGWLRRLWRAQKPEALADRVRSGRPPLLQAAQRRRLQQLLARSPEDFGFFCTGWTVATLRAQLEAEGAPRVSDDTLREAVHRLGYRWKRPRYTLAPDPEREKKARSALDAGLLASPGARAVSG